MNTPLKAKLIQRQPGSKVTEIATNSGQRNHGGPANAQPQPPRGERHRVRSNA
jgi:hypothetical protein